MGKEYSREDLAATIEATRLGPGLTDGRIRAFAQDAAVRGVRGVCVPIRFLESAVEGLGYRRSETDLVTVANFPFGDSTSAIIEAEVAAAIRAGADHIDLVAPLPDVLAGRWDAVRRTLEAARNRADQVHGAEYPMKLILETAALGDDEIEALGAIGVECGFRWLKTSTGFHKNGGATVEHVEMLRRLAPEGVGVKASGGIGVPSRARFMLDAGADRIGTSREEVILGGLPEPPRATLVSY